MEMNPEPLDHHVQNKVDTLLVLFATNKQSDQLSNSTDALTDGWRPG